MNYDAPVMDAATTRKRAKTLLRPVPVVPSMKTVSQDKAVACGDGGVLTPIFNATLDGSGREILAIHIASRGSSISGVGYILATEHRPGDAEDYAITYKKFGYLGGGEKRIIEGINDILQTISGERAVLSFGGDYLFADLFAAQNSCGQRSTIEKFICDAKTEHYDFLRLLRREKGLDRERIDLLFLETIQSTGVALDIKKLKIEMAHVGDIVALYFFWLRKTGEISLQKQRLLTSLLRRFLVS